VQEDAVSRALAEAMRAVAVKPPAAPAQSRPAPSQEEEQVKAAIAMSGMQQQNQVRSFV
jgi:hypothetical protein